MDVLIVSAGQDYANVSYTLQQSLLAVGVNAKAIIKSSRRRGIRAKVIPIKKFKNYAKKAEIIIFMHSLFRNLGAGDKRFFVFHGGGRYRFNPQKSNKIFNPIVEKSLIQTGDLLGLGAKNEVWLLPAVDTDLLQPVYERKSNKIIIGHFPSSDRVKNSEGIGRVIGRIQEDFGHKFEYIFSPKVILWEKQIKRVSACDIYIEACQPHLRRKRETTGPKSPYGEWGIQCLEAASLGKVVITHFLSHKRYEREYGKCSLKVANSLDEIEFHLRELLSLSDDKLLQVRKDTRQWVEKYHSYKSVGERLKEILYGKT